MFNGQEGYFLNYPWLTGTTRSTLDCLANKMFKELDWITCLLLLAY